MVELADRCEVDIQAVRFLSHPYSLTQICVGCCTVLQDRLASAIN